jgi:hypothetical protein
LYTGAPIVVDYKSVPHSSNDIVEWYKRLPQAKRFYEDKNGMDCELLRTLRADYKITHVVLEQGRGRGRCGFLDEVYRDDQYGVYRVTTSLKIDS